MSEQHAHPGAAGDSEDPVLAALRASEEHYRHAVELSPHVPWTADPQGNTQGYDRRWLEITGLTEEEVQGDGWMRSCHPDDLPVMIATWTHSIRTGEPYDIEHRMRMADGEYHWIRARAVPLRDSAGSVLRWYGSTEDIHDRKTAEEALRRSEALHRATVELMGEAVIVLDAQGEVVTLNSAFAAMHGYGSLEEAYLSLWQFDEHVEATDLEGRHIPQSEWPAARARRGEVVRGEILCSANRLTGHSFVGSYSAVPVLSDGVLSHVVVTVHDLSDLIRAQEAQRWQAQLLDTVEQAVIVTDAEGVITYWNAFAERLYGWSAEEAVGRNIMEVTPAETSREEGAAIMERLRGGRSWSGDYLVRRRDGTTFPAWVTDTPIRSERGELIGIIGVSSDVSGRKVVEEALRRAEERLRERVEELAEADRQKDEFLALLSHELRNPLAGITNALHLLNRISSQEERPRELRMLIERQTRYLNRLLEDLLDVTRLTRGLIDLRREPTDLRAAVERAREATRSFVEGREHRMFVELPPEPLYVNGDSVRLEQVLVNLLTNAAKYTEPGGEIRVTARAEDREAILQVTDNGIGVEHELLPRIFDLFTQADRSHARTHGGLGIGLTLVRRIVEWHGGTVMATSRGMAEGSEFTVRLPLTGAAPAAVTPPPAPAPPARSLRVLVIEDNRDAADTLRDLLEMEGHTIEVAYSGPSGVQAAREFHPDVILCDIGLPGMDGYEVARELHSSGVARKARLIAVTGFGQPEDRRRTTEAGFHAHVTKPADPEELLLLIANGNGTHP